MKSIKIGLLSMMTIAILSAFATQKDGKLAVDYYQKNTITGDCTPTACRPNLTILCNDFNTDYYQSDEDDEVHCFEETPLFRN